MDVLNNVHKESVKGVEFIWKKKKRKKRTKTKVMPGILCSLNLQTKNKKKELETKETLFLHAFKRVLMSNEVIFDTLDAIYNRLSEFTDLQHKIEMLIELFIELLSR